MILDHSEWFWKIHEDFKRPCKLQLDFEMYRKILNHSKWIWRIIDLSERFKKILDHPKKFWEIHEDS
jgi:hypothetical protein